MEGNFITVKFGPANSRTLNLAHYPTIQSILTDSALQHDLGFGSNVEAMVSGAARSSGPLYAGDEVTIVTKANTKGC